MITPEAVVDSRNETPRDEENDADIIQLVSNLVHRWGMVGDGVVSRTHA